MATLRTGDVKRFSIDKCGLIDGDNWGYLTDSGDFIGARTRNEARNAKNETPWALRIGRIVKQTPKNVFVKVTK